MKYTAIFFIAAIVTFGYGCEKGYDRKGDLSTKDKIIIQQPPSAEKQM